MKKLSISKGIRLVATTGVAFSVAVALVACDASTGSTGASTDETGTTTAEDADYTAMLDGLYEGTYQEPSGPVIPEPAADKSIWVIPAGLNAEVYVVVADGVKEAGEKLGWNVTVFDGKFSPTAQLSGVQQALAAGADGIITYAVDCPAIRNGLEQAKQAGVPTINIAGQECEPQGYTHTVAYPGFDSKADYIKAYGEAQAQYAIAKTQGKAKVILNTQTDVEAVRLQAEGWRDALANCSDCEIVGDAEFVGADFGPALQSKISQQLLQNPDANVFITAYDAVLTSGGAQALKASGRVDQILAVSGEGSADGIELIRNGAGMDACLGYDAAMEGYAGVNYLVVLFDGQDPSNVHNGVGWQACDSDRNLPPVGEAFVAPLDYQAVYDRLWSLE